MTVLDSIIQRLQNLPPFNIYLIDPKTGVVSPWYEVTGVVVSELVITEEGLVDQVQAVPAQIMFWGRMTAQARRVWEIEERLYRIWRDKMALLLSTPPPKSEPSDEKVLRLKWIKPTIATIDRMIRSNMEYRKYYMAVERAAEAFNASQAILDGFKAKRDMMRAALVRANENSAPRLSI